MPRLEVWSHRSMAEAVECGNRARSRYFPLRGEKKAIVAAIGPRAISGSPERLAAALADSDELITEAIIADPRLARRSQWQRGEEGEVVCPALLSQGDDAPCFYRTRALVGQPNGAEPVRIVISTDASEIPARTAAAFIATVRLVQQYRPVEIYWQGSWLGAGRSVGYVFHVPLVSGDMDFSRLEFCIADPNRDNLSWSVMCTHACEQTHCTWNGCSLQAERSYLPEAQFISHHGITPNGESIAYTASSWLGWDSLYTVSWENKQAASGALQTLPEPAASYRENTPEEKARYAADSARWQRERQERETAAAKAREQSLDHSYT